MEELEFEYEEAEEEEGAGWMTTFADLMSLLLTFFVLLLSFAEMDIIKFRDALGSIQNAFGYVDADPGLSSRSPSAPIEFEHRERELLMQKPVEMSFKQKAAEHSLEAKQNEEILKRIQSSIRENGLEESVIVEVKGRGVVVRVKGQLFFNSGSDVLKEEAHPLLDDIVGIAEEFPYRMGVEGHTDNAPINTDRFRSNWELSTARAISALRYIMDTGRVETDRLGASGYADTRPIAENETPEGRQQNRRVEFIFFKE
jgi:chemotaxis protein MotB